MAKIEEVAALLIEEIENFEKAIAKLKTESDKIHNKRLSLDTSKIEQLFSKFFKNLNTVLKNFDNLSHKSTSTSQAPIIPKLIPILAIFFISITITNSAISFYQIKNQNHIEQAAFTKGRNSILTHIDRFFDENPSALKNYKNWTKTK